MKSNSRHGLAAFTLIELMAVITIIVILAGLVVGGMGFVNERQAKEKAKVQMKLLEKGLEEYKLENGSYPVTGNSTTGSGNSNRLFRALYWDGYQNKTTIYVPELDPATNKQGWTSGTGASTTIVDPWGKEYSYRSGIGTNGKPSSNTQNPDFDLWSCGKDGKTRAGRNDDPEHKDNRDDLRNF